MQVKRIGPFSAFKVGGALYGLMGLIFGAFMSLFSIVGAGIAGVTGDGEAVIGALFGIGAIVFLPIFYGVLGGVMAAISAFFYNLVASWFGGIEVDLE